MTNEAPGSRPRVLVVEDERALADIYVAWLAERYEVELAHDGETALATYDEHVDVVLLAAGCRGSAVTACSSIRNAGGRCRVAMVSAVTPNFDIYGRGSTTTSSSPSRGTNCSTWSSGCSA